MGDLPDAPLSHGACIFVGGMAYQDGVDYTLIGQYAPATITNLDRTRGGSGNTGSAATGSAASTSGRAAQP
jgi:hypothetical protein